MVSLIHSLVINPPAEPQAQQQKPVPTLNRPLIDSEAYMPSNYSAQVYSLLM